MVLFVALFGGWGLFRLLGLLGVSWFDGWAPALAGGLALMFLLTGTAHFSSKRRNDLIAMVPPSLPFPARLVDVTGVLELAGVVGLLLPPTSRLAAGCLAVLLVLMFPANVYAARHSLGVGGEPATPLPRRTVEQFVYIGACVAVVLA
ncbi:DoxX family protein [Pseudonocardia acaciae]|uniref:DoxX family protein n=1 Tax=Pseudonocardia acaciae TaxID=551276 RepID=UPI00048EC8F1|nr:DoxX family protein [Pseudonocardia acaciae]